MVAAALLRRRARAGAPVTRCARSASSAAAALAFGIAGFYNLPLRDYARYSIRGGGAGGGVGMDYATGWSLAPYELPTVVVPGWAGFGGATYWGGMPFTDYPNAFVGLVAVLLAVPAFLAGGAPRVLRAGARRCSRCSSRSAATSRSTASSTTTCRCSTSSASR